MAALFGPRASTLATLRGPEELIVHGLIGMELLGKKLGRLPRCDLSTYLSTCPPNLIRLLTVSG